jgi:D-glycero-beta-D-manno-heptose 1-phosphate adenylyltransferase
LKRPDLIPQKIYTLDVLMRQVKSWQTLGKKVAFTNGVFDLLHAGHIASLSAAAKEADYLIVGVNSDTSVKRLKGASRPINDEASRALILAAMVLVDAVIIFDEDTPLQLITGIMPNTIVKGGDYTLEQIVGAKEVIANGGNVVINKIIPGFSTTNIIAKMSDEK